MAENHFRALRVFSGAPALRGGSTIFLGRPLGERTAGMPAGRCETYGEKIIDAHRPGANFALIKGAEMIFGRNESKEGVSRTGKQTLTHEIVFRILTAYLMSVAQKEILRIGFLKMSKNTAHRKGQGGQSIDYPKILFGSGAIGLGLVTAWRNVAGRIAGAANDADMIKEILTGLSMEMVGVGAAAMAVASMKHDRLRAIALGLVSAFAYASNTRASYANLENQFQNATNAIEVEQVNLERLDEEIATLEKERDAIVERYDGVVPRTAETLDAWVEGLPGGREDNPINAARAEAEKGDRKEYNRLSEAIAGKLMLKSSAKVAANDEVQGTGGNDVMTAVEITGMQALQALGFWLADTRKRHQPHPDENRHQNQRRRQTETSRDPRNKVRRIAKNGLLSKAGKSLINDTHRG